MAIVYETEQIYTGPRTFQANPIKGYLKHYGNYRYLKFIFDNSKDGLERRQASLEMGIAQKKMDRFYSMIPFTERPALETAKKEIDRPWDTK